MVGLAEDAARPPLVEVTEDDSDVLVQELLQLVLELVGEALRVRDFEVAQLVQQRQEVVVCLPKVVANGSFLGTTSWNMVSSSKDLGYNLEHFRVTSFPNF